MQKKRSIKIVAIMLILVLICISITYFKNDSKEVLATTREFNSENLQDNEHMHVEIDNSGDKVPVPNGYVGSKAAGENEIDTGYVIYEGEEEVNDENVEDAQKTRNQYVWIPVPDASTMYGTDTNGKKWGKLYSFTTEIGENIDPITGAKPLNWSESDGIMKIINKVQRREPDIIKDYDVDSRIKELDLDSNTTHLFLLQLEREFNNMIKSVEKYGGFYIGRYETGNLNKEEVVIRKQNTYLDNQQTWYMAYKKCRRLNNSNGNIGTGLLWGCQFYRTLVWLIESGNKTKEEICKDSTGWGNYKDATFEYIDNNGNTIIKNIGEDTIIPTGSTEYTKSNNIYDLAGNVNEWNMIALDSFARLYMGGAYYNQDNFSVDSNDATTPYNINAHIRLSSNAIYKMMI